MVSSLIKNCKLLGAALGCLLSVNFVSAQDIHFSQPEAAPQWFNPALGATQSDLEVSLNYRTQWRSVPSGFNTSYASIAARFKSKTDHHAIIGCSAYNDKAGNGNLRTNGINLNAGYSVRVSDRSRLIGAVGLEYRQVLCTDLSGKWGSQFNGLEYDAGIASGEAVQQSQFGVVNINSGFVFHFASGMNQRVFRAQKTFTCGLGVFQLNTPSYSFYEVDNNALPARWTGFATGSYPIDGTKGIIEPAVYVQKQGKFHELQVGMYYCYVVKNPAQYTHFTRRLNLAWGVFYRWNDAIIFKTKLDWSDFSAGISYDINHSNLRESTQLRGATEFFLSYRLQR